MTSVLTFDYPFDGKPKVKGLHGLGNERKAYKFTRMDLEEACTKRYDRFPYVLPFVFHDADGAELDYGYRLILKSLAETGAEYRPMQTAVFLDIDTPRHSGFRDGDKELVLEWLNSPELITWGYYFTKRGLRLYKPLARKVSPQMGQAITSDARRAMTPLIGDLWLHMDDKASDIFRIYKLPWGAQMEPWSQRPASEPWVWNEDSIEAIIMRDKRERERPLVRGGNMTIASEADVDAGVMRMARSLSEYLRQGHSQTIALGMGTLMSRLGMPCDSIPDLVHRIYAAAGDLDPAERATGAKWSADGYASGGLFKSERHVPLPLTEVIVEVMSGEKVIGRPVDVVSLAEAQRLLRACIASPVPGLSMVQSQCGIGKTRTTEEVAVERAELGYKTVITVPDHDLAKQIFEHLDGRVRLRRLQSPHRGDCKLADTAIRLATGGYSVGAELCNGGGKRGKCQYYEGCTARKGYVGEDVDPEVIIAPHALIATAVEQASEDSLLVIDEPPLAVGTVAISRGTLRAYETFRRYFVPEARDIGLEAVRWLSGVYAQGAHVVPEDLRVTEDVSHLRSGAGRSPKLDGFAWDSITSGRMQSLELMACARLWGLVTDPSVGYMVNQDGELCAVVPEYQLLGAMSTAPRCVLLDANGDISGEVIESMLKVKVPVTKIYTSEGAVCERTWWREKASRTRLCPKQVVNTATVEWFLKRIVEWASDCQAFGIITYKAVYEALQFKVPGNCELMYYGHVRGSDKLKHVDALVTLGDPLEPVSVSEYMCDMLGLDDSLRRLAWSSRRCDAELEQAHGRLRLVHRAKPAKLLHIGMHEPRFWNMVLTEQ